MAVGVLKSQMKAVKSRNYFVYLGIADDVEAFLCLVLLSRTAFFVHQYKIDRLSDIVLQPSMPKLPLHPVARGPVAAEVLTAE